MRKGEVGGVGLQVNARPMGYLRDDWWDKETHKFTFPFAGWVFRVWVGNWKI